MQIHGQGQQVIMYMYKLKLCINYNSLSGGGLQSNKYVIYKPTIARSTCLRYFRENMSNNTYFL